MAYEFNRDVLDDSLQAFNTAISEIEGFAATTSGILAGAYEPIELPDSLDVQLEDATTILDTYQVAFEPRDINPILWPTELLTREPLAVDFGEATYEDVSTQVWKENVWIFSQEAQDIKTAIDNAIVSGNPEFFDGWQDAIFQMDEERNLKNLTDALSIVSAATGARGFRKSNSRTDADRRVLIRDYTWERTQQSRKIVQLLTEHARTFVQFAMEKGIAFEAMSVGFTEFYDKIFLDAKKVAVELYAARLNAEIAKFEGLVKQEMFKLDWQKGQIELLAVKASTEIDQIRANIEQNKQENQPLRDYLETLRTLVARYNAEVALLQVQVADSKAAVDSANERSSIAGRTFAATLGHTMAGLSASAKSAGEALKIATAAEFKITNTTT